MRAFTARVSWVDSYRVRFAHGRGPVRRGHGIAHGSQVSGRPSIAPFQNEALHK